MDRFDKGCSRWSCQAEGGRPQARFMEMVKVDIQKVGVMEEGARDRVRQMIR